jgi:dTDP-4-dehydrorhamnose reductase
MRYLITGGAGLLGQIILRCINKAEIDCTHTYHRIPTPSDLVGHGYAVDLTDAAAVEDLWQKLRPAVVIHTAANTSRPHEIAPITANVAQATANLGAKLVHISTDVVFDGYHAPYAETAQPNPTNPYGKAKALAETLVQQHTNPYSIVRTSLIFNQHPLDHQTQWMLAGLQRGEIVRLFTDEYRSPIWAYNLAQAVLEIAKHPYLGIWHCTGSERISRWDYGNAVLDLIGYLNRNNLQATTITASGLTRPPDLTLDLAPTQARLHTPLLAIRAVLTALSQPNATPITAATRLGLL